MKSHTMKNNSVESLLLGAVKFKNLTPELYLEAKEANISDQRIIDLCGTNLKAFTAFKHQNGLIGVTVPAYQSIIKKAMAARSKETIVEGTSQQSIFDSGSPELQLKVKALEEELKTANGLLLEKDKDINRLNNENGQMQENLNQASRLIRGLESENERLRNGHPISKNEETRLLQANIQLYRGIVKNLAILL